MTNRRKWTKRFIVQGHDGVQWYDTAGAFVYKTKRGIPKCIFKNTFLRIVERRERVVKASE
jgi:hypothetical protein